MFLSKLLLVGFLFFQCLESGLCESKSDSKFSSGVIASSRSSPWRFRDNGKLSSNGVILRRTQQQKSLCLNKKSCQQKRPNAKRPHKRRKKNKRCCRNRLKMCKRRFRKSCNKVERCLIKNSVKCQKQFSRCNNRKSANRRPGNCDLFNERRKNKNKSHSRHRVFQKIPTTPKPVIRKQLNDECTTAEDCQPGLCCARHGTHRRICKRLILEGQVCTRDFRSQKRSPEQFERCPCNEGLVCSPPGPKEIHMPHTCQVIT